MRTNTKSPQRRGARKGSNKITLSSGQTITERPILFQTEMVKSILKGRKTQTRRNLKEVELKVGNVPGHYSFEYRKKGVYEAGMNISSKNLNLPFTGILDYCRFGKPGDLLWVRETCQHTRVLNINPQDENYGYVYKADDQPWADYEGWIYKPSIHMPKDAARIWLMVEDIRVERVQDISEEDARAEGVEYIESDNFFEKGYKNYLTRDLDDPNYDRAINSFETLWISINGQDSFDSNPWVWVIQFRVLSTTGKPSEEIIQKNLCDLCASAVSERKEVSNV